MKPFLTPRRNAVRFALPARALLLACAFQSATPLFADGGTFPPPPVPVHAYRSLAATLPPPPPQPPSALRSAFPETRLYRMDPAEFHAYVARNPDKGRLLNGAELGALANAGKARPARKAKPQPPAAAPEAGRPATLPACDTLLDSLRRACYDSIATLALSKRDSVAPPGKRAPVPRALAEMQARDAAKRDSLARARGDSVPARRDTLTIESRDPTAVDPPEWVVGDPGEAEEASDLRDARAAEEAEEQSWFVHLVADVSDGPGSGGGWGGDELAAVLYVVVGVVVVGAFLIYGIQTLVELAANTEDYPLFHETGLRLSYSGKTLQSGDGAADLYRDAYLAGLRYAVGFNRPGMDVGLAFEGGYIDVWLSPLDGQGRSWDFRSGYFVAGPLIRFGSYDPFCFSLEFLNGTSAHGNIGWISKSRMTLAGKVGRHTTLGGHLGAVFYDLEFLDGLGWRRGNFNRDLSLIMGMDAGWAF